MAQEADGKAIDDFKLDAFQKEFEEKAAENKKKLDEVEGKMKELKELMSTLEGQKKDIEKIEGEIGKLTAELKNDEEAKH